MRESTPLTGLQADIYVFLVRLGNDYVLVDAGAPGLAYEKILDVAGPSLEHYCQLLCGMSTPVPQQWLAAMGARQTGIFEILSGI